MNYSLLIISGVLVGLGSGNIAWGEEYPRCRLRGEFVVEGKSPKYSLSICAPGMAGGNSPSGMLVEDLASLWEKKKNDPVFVRMLKAAGLGDDYASAYRNLQTMTGRPFRIYSDDLPGLQSMRDQLNEVSGITAELNREAKEESESEAARKKREMTPIPINGPALTRAAEQNKKVISQIRSKECRDNTKAESGLEIYQVHFADGEKAILMPHAFRWLKEPTDAEVTMQSLDNGLGGIQVNEGTLVRYLRFSKSGVVWIGPNGVEYPIKHFSKMLPSEALGWARPMNSGSAPDVCLWARYFGPEPKSLSPVPAEDPSKAGE